MEAVPLRSAQIQGQQKKQQQTNRERVGWRGVEGWGGGQEPLYPMLHCQHQKDFCMKIGSDEGHFNVSSGAVTRQRQLGHCHYRVHSALRPQEPDGLSGTGTG